MSTARENLYEMATVAFKETGVPPAVHAAVTLMLDMVEREHASHLARKIRNRDVDYLGHYNMGWQDAADLIDPDVDRD
ncbi:hypothetical protein [Streptomyces sp. NBC_01264]|uniref:hypothetical protein n=1 Tax=Streptomyces sp. NBC_01264 TaxID=2903804 RepID=UPI002257F0BF|nr:hypothetical protein [Streptomyces sp. NBC_01264]MCX4778188.1 hypothetical protein [Streptomyces sp. NBC_01264]